MLARGAHRVLTHPPRHSLPLIRSRSRPSDKRFFIQGLCNEFLDVAIALPLPPSLPPYSTTIVLVTIITRLGFLPLAIWAKRRQWRIEEKVLPELERLKPIVSQDVLKEMKGAGIRGKPEELQKIHSTRARELLTARRKELFKEYRCRPVPTMLAPIVPQIPVFILLSVVFGRLSLPPTPLDSESLLTLTSLASPDPTMALPILLGVITMANVESSNWVLSAEERRQQQAKEEQNEKKRLEGGQRTISPKKAIKSGLRILSLARIAFAAIMPGSIVVYWVTSASLGLLQTWALDVWDIRRKRARKPPMLNPLTLKGLPHSKPPIQNPPKPPSPNANPKQHKKLQFKIRS